MKNFMFGVVLFLMAVAAPVVRAQTPAVTGDPFETGWHVSVNGGYSNMSGQETNNGALTSVAVRVAKHFNARLDYFMVASPKAAVIVAGPEYNFSLAHILPQSSFFEVAKLEGFVNARIGAGRAGVDSSPFKLAVALGGGINYHVSSLVTVRPVEVSYVRSAASGTQIIGNHMAFASSIGLRF